MKNIGKYITAAAAMVIAFASCEEMEDYQKTIDAAPQLAYVHPKSGDTFETLVVHRPIGSTGEYTNEFQVSANNTNHPDVNVHIVLAPELVAGYNEKHGTSYETLPEEYVEIENAHVVIPENANISTDTVRVHLSQAADLTKLTERSYLAPLKVVSEGMETSEEMGTLWFIVNTEINLIRPISSENDMVGFEASKSGWTADCANYDNLFDSNTNTSVDFGSGNQVLTIDMKSTLMVTGIKLRTYNISGLSIEYSTDGEEWSQAGTPVSGEYVFTGSSYSEGDYMAAVYDYFEARYLRLSFSQNGYYTGMKEVSVYMIESTEPTIYTVTGTDNVVTGKVVHKKGKGSTARFDASFKVYSTISSENGWNVAATVDNSLIAAFNQKNGTSYKALPSENLEIQNASLSIAAGGNASDEEVSLRLTGDLSSLTEEDGYLVPVRLSASGAVTSEGRGTVYAIIKSETNLIKAISSTDEIVGFPAGGRSSWSSPDVSNAANLFDDNNSSSVSFSNSGNVLTVNMGQTHLVTGLHFYTYNLSGLSIEYSADGSSWKSAGTVESGEAVYTGSNWSAGDYYVAFADYLEANYLRLSFGFSGYYRNVYEFSVYEIESTEPTIYTVCGTDNTIVGTVTHHVIAGSSASLNASFNAMTTVSSPEGYSVNAVVDNSLIAAYNSKNGTNYASLNASNVELTGVPCTIAAGANSSADKIKVSLTGDLSKLTNSNGYLIPVKLEAPAGAVVSEGRGVVYVALNVETSDAAMRTGFDINSIEGSVVADRSGWKILSCDEGGIYNGTYAELFDGNTTTYVRTWGGPVTFTVDLGKEYEMTGLVITARTDNSSYSRYQPTSIQVMGSVDNIDFADYGTASTSEGTIVAARPSSYVSFYGSKTVRYLKIEAGYGSNMGTSEFNIYVK